MSDILLMNKIVVLDGQTLTGNDLSWEALEKLGAVTVHDRTPPEDVVARCQGAAIVLTNKVVLGEAQLAKLPELRYIGVLATGTNVVDLGAANSRGIVITNVPAYSTKSVAQSVFGLLLELANRTSQHNAAVHAGQWSSCIDFSFRLGPLVELDGLTLGIVGMGAIGQAVAHIGHALGMKILAYSRTRRELANVLWADTPAALFAASDVVSLNCPLTPETKEMINKTSLRRFKPTAFLINCGRGPLVHEAALAAALNAGLLAGYGTDVLATEPPATDNPLLTAKNCVITPHIAWATRAARERLLATVIANVAAFLADNPQNRVNFFCHKSLRKR